MPRTLHDSRLYNANLVKASLKVPESRIIAGLLIDGANSVEWHQAIIVQNVLQKRSPHTAKLFADFIANRLKTLQPAAWPFVKDGSNSVATQLVLAATIKYSRLLGDFLDLVVRERRRTFASHLTDLDWSEFVEGCKARDPGVNDWTEGVVKKLRQNTFRILAEQATFPIPDRCCYRT